MHSLVALLALSVTPAATDVGPLVRSLWLVQRYGTADAVAPMNDQRLKGLLAKALGKDGELTFNEVKGVMDQATFHKLAGNDERLGTEEIRRAVEAACPESRGRLLPKVREYCDSLTASFDMIDEQHRAVSRELADWIAKSYRPGEPLDVIVVCTGNSRRSILGSTMGNVAAAYYGMPEIRFRSGGTAPTAFNVRTVNALKDIGVEIGPTGKDAPRGEPQTANPVFRVRWGASEDQGAPAMEALEFSKRYDDAANPRSGFATLMVCSEADAACPTVTGAAVRISTPYLDPKIYDGGSLETAKYAERRDDIGRMMLAAMMQARQHLAAATTQAKGTR
jgi:hypothetical protein